MFFWNRLSTKRWDLSIFLPVYFFGAQTKHNFFFRFSNMEKYIPPNWKITCNWFPRNLGILYPSCLMKSFICITWLYLSLNLSKFNDMIIFHAMHSPEHLIVCSSHTWNSLTLLKMASNWCTLQFNSVRWVPHSFSSKKKAVRLLTRAQSVKQHFILLITALCLMNWCTTH